MWHIEQFRIKHVQDAPKGYLDWVGKIKWQANA